MKKFRFAAVLLIGAMLAIPAMAEKIELTNTELAQISAQGWDSNTNLARAAAAEPAGVLTEARRFSMGNIAQGTHGVQICMAPTTIKIDSITSETPFGVFAAGDLEIRVTARVTLTE